MVECLPRPVTPTPTLSLLDRVSRCKPQAPCGFSRVTGSGQACPSGQGGWGPLEGVCLLPSALPRGEGVRAGPHHPRPAKAMFVDSASSLWGPGTRETPSWASHSSGCPLKPHGPHAGTEAGPEPSGAQARGGAPGRRRSRALGPRSWWPGAPRVGPPTVGQGATHAGPPACVCAQTPAPAAPTFPSSRPAKPQVPPPWPPWVLGSHGNGGCQCFTSRLERLS